MAERRTKGGTKYCGGSPAKITDAQLVEACKTMTRQQIADKYNMHIESVQRRMHKLGIHAIGGVDVECKERGTCGEIGALVLQRINAARKEQGDTWHYTQRCAALIERRQPGFELVEFKRNRCRIRCKTCGNIVERDRATIKEKNVRCDVCFRRQQEEKLRQATITKLIKVFAAVEEKKKPKVCPCCGEVFYSGRPDAKWCPRCKTMSGNYSARAKKYGAVYEHGITLRKVIIRDKGICQICGKPVDMNDRSWNGYVGPLYPSTDHIIPLARGGAHIWSNVQLAHAMCNSIKGATVEI